MTDSGPLTGEVATAAVAASGTPPDPGRTAGIAAIWVRELRGRMRGKRAFIFLTFYLSLLAGILWLALRTTEHSALTVNEAMGVGRGLFAWALMIETLVVVALAPAYTAGAITSEREKQTYDLLAVTPISSLSLVIGKLLSGLSYLALIVLASIPITAVALLFGGIDPSDLVRGYLVMFAAGLAIGAIGIWCSAAMGRTQSATVAAFILTGVFVVGLSAAWLAIDARLSESGRNDRPPQALLLFNPFVAQMDVICQASGEGCFAQQAAMPRDNGVVLAGPIDPATGMPADMGQGFQAVVPQPLAPGGDFWPLAVLVYVGGAAFAIFGASQSISPTRRWRWRPTLRRSPPATEATADD